MINPYFKEKFSFTYNYFSLLLEKVSSGEKKFPQAIVFEGNDTINSYLFTLELARNLNCENTGNIDCDCLNCKWIKSYTHPAVNNVSQIHLKGEDDLSKTVISVKQAKEIENQLTLSSDYHRFYIFFSSKEKVYDPFELNVFQQLGYDTNINYSIEPLNFSTFNVATPNKLLKSVEEPPNRTTFVFLTNSRENILQTIVSRCLVFKLNSNVVKKGYSDILNIVSDYPNFDYIKALNVADYMLELTKNDIPLEDILLEFIAYLKDLMIKNFENSAFSSKIQRDIQIINRAIKYKKATIQDKSLLEGLMLEIARG